MDDCVQKEIDKKTACHTSCVNSLSTGGDKALKCALDARAARNIAFGAFNLCLEKALGRPCTTTRVRRSPMGAGFPGAVGGAMSPFGKIKLTGTAQAEFKSFNKCVSECLHKDDPKPVGFGPKGFPQGRRDQQMSTTEAGQAIPRVEVTVTQPGDHGDDHHHYEWTTTPAAGQPGQQPRGPGGNHVRPNGRPSMFYGACPIINKCKLAHLDRRKNEAGVDECVKAVTATPSTIDQTFCTCLQGVYSADTVACNFSTGQ
jgi:hypothetical protein